ncbi:MAG: hypothetical protein O6499_06815 [Candidatus Dadabacteria bacterium]|nr:hypothetical protein [Candidatus Dadabacteria bacterium]MCZ6469347.1 hypothetical protein [Candidatus Dadabacteria bacterium]TDI90541.1 MAG: hypothetical protein E2O72_03880 [Candidatus Dadabacteria bacterium]TDJ03191.1 MAG: hypothetical protein E2O70_00295 [Candidatus Dadabacteria bacterium]
MALKFKIKENYFQDALRLMRISKNVRESDGVKNAVAVMATDKAKYALEDAGLMTPQIKEASGSDLVIAVEANTNELADQTIEQIEGLVSSDASGGRASSDIIGQEIRVVNIGLDIFKEALEAQDVKVVQVDWEVPAKGDEKVINVLKKMY